MNPAADPRVDQERAALRELLADYPAIAREIEPGGAASDVVKIVMSDLMGVFIERQEALASRIIAWCEFARGR